jgi:MYXO-CTERM domain-containing protein
MEDSVVEPGTYFMRMQNPGATRYTSGKYYSNITNTGSANMFLAHELAGFTDNWLDDGSAHIEFRARLAIDEQACDLDQVDCKRAFSGDAIEKPWPNFGAGANCRSTGKNMIDVHQVVSDAGSPTTLAGKIIGFGLDAAGGAERNGFGILNMNALNGNITSEDVDFGEGLDDALAGINPNAKENYMLIPNVEQWHTYAIDIIADFDGIGTHDVTVTVDGVYTQTFTVTAGADEYYPGVSDDVEYKDLNYVSLGDGQSRSSFAFDLDYLTVTPEPMTLTLLGLGGLGLLRRRRA